VAAAHQVFAGRAVGGEGSKPLAAPAPPEVSTDTGGGLRPTDWRGRAHLRRAARLLLPPALRGLRLSFGVRAGDSHEEIVSAYRQLAKMYHPD